MESRAKEIVKDLCYKSFRTRMSLVVFKHCHQGYREFSLLYHSRGAVAVTDNLSQAHRVYGPYRLYRPIIVRPVKSACPSWHSGPRNFFCIVAVTTSQPARSGAAACNRTTRIPAEPQVASLPVLAQRPPSSFRIVAVTASTPACTTTRIPSR